MLLFITADPVLSKWCTFFKSWSASIRVCWFDLTSAHVHILLQYYHRKLLSFPCLISSVSVHRIPQQSVLPWLTGKYGNNGTHSVFSQVLESESLIFCRAPELFAVPSHCDIDEKTDIWSLGCLLFALMYFKSPFDRSFTNTVPTSVANPGSGAFLIPGSGIRDG